MLLAHGTLCGCAGMWGAWLRGRVCGWQQVGYGRQHSCTCVYVGTCALHRRKATSFPTWAQWSIGCTVLLGVGRLCWLHFTTAHMCLECFKNTRRQCWCCRWQHHAMAIRSVWAVVVATACIFHICLVVRGWVVSMCSEVLCYCAMGNQVLLPVTMHHHS